MATLRFSNLNFIPHARTLPFVRLFGGAVNKTKRLSNCLKVKSTRRSWKSRESKVTTSIRHVPGANSTSVLFNQTPIKQIKFAAGQRELRLKSRMGLLGSSRQTGIKNVPVFLGCSFLTKKRKCTYYYYFNSEINF
jgi:hypothetical protein